MTLPEIIDTCLFRQRRVFLAVLAVVIAGTALITFTLPKVYEATATLVVGENRPLNQGGDIVARDELLARSYGELLKTPATLDAASKALPFPVSQSDLETKVSSEVVTGTQLIRITASDENPERATAIANSYATSFVRIQQRSVRDAAQSSLKELERRITELVDARGEVTDEAELEQIETELEGVRASYRATQQNISLQGTNLAVASRADVPDSPAKPRPKLYMAIGIVFALILAVLAALLRNAFDQRVRTEDEVLDVMGAPVLSRIPTDDGSPATTSRVDEAFQFLRSNMQLQDPARAVRLIAVTSPASGDGKSSIVGRLAEALALTGANVIVVDADVRKPGLGEIFGVETGDGFTNALVAGVDPADLLVPTPYPNVRLLPAGPVPPNPAVLLGAPRAREVLRELEAMADYVLIDTPPVTVGADTSAISAVADGVIVVLSADRLTREGLFATREQLDRSSARILGLVLNRTIESGENYGYYAAGAETPARA